MAFSMHTGRKTPMAEINVTPLVDVMLVLLIIFMVTAPMMQEGLPLTLPDAKGTALTKERSDVEEIVVSVSDKGGIYVNETEVPENRLIERIQEMTKDKPREVYLRGDKNVPYGVVVRVMSALRGGGIANLSMITSPHEESAPGK